MSRVSALLSMLLVCLTIGVIAGAVTPRSAAVIDVQVTGPLVLAVEKGEMGLVVVGYVRAEGRDLLLDCTANEAAHKLLTAAQGNLGPSTNSALKTAKVKGKLKFRPDVKLNDTEKRVEPHSIPVIRVESLEIVE